MARSQLRKKYGFTVADLVAAVIILVVLAVTVLPGVVTGAMIRSLSWMLLLTPLLLGPAYSIRDIMIWERHGDPRFQRIAIMLLVGLWILRLVLTALQSLVGATIGILTALILMGVISSWWQHRFH